ncbi:MAG: RIP metalloprotease RseP, partial [Acidobacteriota bacterium]
LGHVLVAKWKGVTVLRFSLGFGPKLIAVQRGETEYCLSAIPLGGYVKMLGEDVDEEVSEEDLTRSFGAQSVYKRMAIVLAGPFSNFILAIVIFALVFTMAGIPYRTSRVGGVVAGSPAEQAGLKAGDKILSIGGTEIKTWDDLSETIEKSGEKALTLQVQRDDKVLTITMTPRVSEAKNMFGETEKRAMIGVSPAGDEVEYKTLNPISALFKGIEYTLHLSWLFLVTIWKMISGIVSVKTLGGPILIAQMAGQQASAGLVQFFHFMALISVNLAVINLLPVPIRDGGHILVFVIEAIKGKPLSTKKMEYAQKAGLVILLLLMAVVFYNDISRLITGGKMDF